MKCTKETGPYPVQDQALSPTVRRELKAELDRLVGDMAKDLFGEPVAGPGSDRDDEPRR
ncbi:MAG: hypothetical protein QNJ67_23775 [Kiloniellales bacterium]|nr:hypothetical protein [Kiloniellales bacterium]